MTGQGLTHSQKLTLNCMRWREGKTEGQKKASHRA